MSTAATPAQTPAQKPPAQQDDAPSTGHAFVGWLKGQYPLYILLALLIIA